MIVRNQTSDPVEYDQNGPSPNEEESLAANAGEMAWKPLGAGEEKEFEAQGTKPFYVGFRTQPGVHPKESAWVVGLDTNDVEVTLTGFPTVAPT